MAVRPDRPRTAVHRPGRHPPERPRGLASTFAALAYRDFRWLWLGTMASFTAMQMQQVARGYLAFEISGAATALGIVSLASGIPQVLLAPIGGVVVDRVPKRTLLYISQGTQAVTALITSVLIYLGIIEVWHLAALAVVNGGVFAFNLPARQSIIPQLVPERVVSNALAINNSGMNLTRLFGPATAGVMIAIPFIGTSGTFLAMSLLYVVVLVMLGRLREAGLPDPAAGDEAPLQAMRSGLTFLLRSPAVRVLFGLSVLVVIFGMPYQMLMPVFAATVFQVDSTGLGILYTVSGVGGLAGSLLVAYLSDVGRKGLAQLVCGLVFSVGLLLFALSTNFFLACLLLIVTGMASNGFAAFNSMLIVLNTPQRLYGRVMSLYLITFGIMPLALLPIAGLADAIGVQLTTVICAVGLLLGVVGALLFAREHRSSGAPSVRPD